MNALRCLCTDCNDTRVSSSRRGFLMGAAAATVAGAFSPYTFAKGTSVPRPENVLTPDAAIERLMAGNERYVSGKITAYDYVAARGLLKKAQNPYACILSCADSRVEPSVCFNESLGDLFITRDAGNYVNLDLLASLEYGTVVLGASLIMVLGHTQCGAVKAAIDAEENNTDFPGHIQIISSAIAEPVQKARAKNLVGDNLLKAVTIENVLSNVELLRKSTPLLSRLIKAGKLKVIGGVYNLDSGRVELVT
jgi:carbonic anhydrase